MMDSENYLCNKYEKLSGPKISVLIKNGTEYCRAKKISVGERIFLNGLWSFVIWYSIYVQNITPEVILTENIRFQLKIVNFLLTQKYTV